MRADLRLKSFDGLWIVRFQSRSRIVGQHRDVEGVRLEPETCMCHNIG